MAESRWKKRNMQPRGENAMQSFSSARQKVRSPRMETETTHAMPSDDQSGLVVLAKVENNNFVVNSEVLYQFLSQPELEGRPLVVISISGAFRLGKSFIMNFLLRYLRNKGWRGGNWFGDDATEATGGFPWRKGVEACTKGITVWPEVFSVPTTDGRQAAVIIVDTQGLFDEDTPPDINAKLLSLSTVFSSHQILNIHRQIEERDLEHLQLCVEFAKVAASRGRGSNAKPFQKLTFLIRDWEHTTSFGDGTATYLQKYFGKRSKSTEVQEVKESIFRAFDSVRCNLLPHPGKKVATPIDGHTLTNKDIDEDFREHVTNFVESVLHPDNLVIKQSKDGGEETTTGLTNLLAAVGSAFVAGKVPKAETLLSSVVRGNNTKALVTAVGEYRKNMDQVSGVILDDEALNIAHQTSLKFAQRYFRSLANIGSDKDKGEFLQQMKVECEQALKTYVGRNQLKKSEKLQEFRRKNTKSSADYAEQMRKVCQTSVDEAVFDRTHRKHQQRLMSEFDAATREYRKAIPGIEEIRVELVRLISSNYEQAKETWRERRLREKTQEQKRELDCRIRVINQFEDKARQYEDKYTENMESILASLVARYEKEYKEELASNGYVNVKAIKARLEKIKQDCISTAYKHYKGEIENLGQIYAQELEASLQKAMANAYIKESKLDASVAKFEKSVKTRERYVNLPQWGRKIVEDAIQEEAKRLKSVNEENKPFRVVILSTLAAIWEFFKNVGKKIVGKFLKLFSSDSE